MSTIKKYLGLLLIFLQASFFAGPLPADSPSAEPSGLLNSVFYNPSKGYHGQMVVNTWSGTESRAEDVKVYFSPPNQYRFEFLSPDGKVGRIVLSNGLSEQVQIVEKNQIGATYTKKYTRNILTPQDEKELLLKNYTATIKEAEPILGRRMMLVTLSPVVSGKPHQDMRIDHETKVIMEIRRHTPEGNTGFVMRFTKFQPSTKLGKKAFLSESTFDSLNTKDWTNDAPEEVAYSVEKIYLLPSRLVGGFVLEGGNQFEVNGRPVNHAWYTDGLLPVSLFHTPLPVKSPEAGQTFIEWNRPLNMGSSAVGNVYQWKKDKKYYTLIGDVQQSLLEQIAGSIK